MTKSRGILTPRHRWTESELEKLHADFPNRKSGDIAAELGVKVHVVHKAAQKLGLKKSAAFLSSEASGRLSKMIQRGIDHRFKKGWPNLHRQGKPFPTRGRMGLTQFKKGQRPHNARYAIGDRRVNADGYLDRKVSNDRKGALNWVAEHRLVWIEANGAIPPGHIVAFKPGCRTTDLAKITPDVLELLPLEEHMRRHTVHTTYPQEVVRLIQLKGQIRRQINRRLAREKQDG